MLTLSLQQSRCIQLWLSTCNFRGAIHKAQCPGFLYSDPLISSGKELPRPASLPDDLAPPRPMAGTFQKATKTRPAGQVYSLGAAELELEPSTLPSGSLQPTGQIAIYI